MTLTAIRPLAGRGKGRETVDPFPGRFLQATGSYREGETDRRVAVAVPFDTRADQLLHLAVATLEALGGDGPVAVAALLVR